MKYTKDRRLRIYLLSNRSQVKNPAGLRRFTSPHPSLFFWILVDANEPLGVGEGLYRGGGACRSLLGSFLQNGRGKIKNATGDRPLVTP